jgi:hypothetical protein
MGGDQRGHQRPELNPFPPVANDFQADISATHIAGLGRFAKAGATSDGRRASRAWAGPNKRTPLQALSCASCARNWDGPG